MQIHRSKHVVDIGRPDLSNRIVQRLHVDCEENEDLECEFENPLDLEPAIRERLSVGKGFLRSSALLVGAAVCSTSHDDFSVNDFSSQAIQGELSCCRASLLTSHPAG